MLNNARVRGLIAGVVEPPARGLVKLGLSPDAVTITGMAGGSVAVLICFPTGHLVLGVLLFAVFTCADVLDGTMARISGRSGPWGNFLDATCDRLSDGAIFAGLALYGMGANQPWTVGGAVAALVAGQVVSYAKARAEAVGATANVGIAERAERNIVALLAALLTGLSVPYVLPIAMWGLAAVSVVTVIQRVHHVRRQLRA